MCTCVPIVSATQRLEEGLRFLGAGVTGCEQPAWNLRIETSSPPPKAISLAAVELISLKKIKKIFFYSTCMSILFACMSDHVPYVVLGG